MKKLGLCILILCLCLVSGCGSPSKATVPHAKKSFSKDGFQICLTQSFLESSSPAVFAAYDSNEIIVRVIRCAFADLKDTDFASDMAIDSFARAYLLANYPETEIEEKDGLFFFTLCSKDGPEEKETLRSCFFFKGSDAFFLVTFSAKKSRFPDLEESILGFAQSVTVS